MNAPEEIVQIRRRMGALEHELAQLRQRVGAIEAAVVTSPFEVPVSAGVDLRSESPPPAPVAAAIPAPKVDAPPFLARHDPPVSAGPAFPPPPPVPPAIHPWRDWLERLQLWPPSGEEDTEVRLAAWWATRVGALLAVIGIVFLGIYVSRNSPPWVRLAEIVVVTAAVLGLGAWLERPLPKFGGVVSGAGLALAYFCAFAAYGVPTMKVITSPTVALVCELAVVAAILALAWARNSPVVATMAVGLGHVTALLALRHGAGEFGPWVVLLLGVGAVLLRWMRGWAGPSTLAMPLAWCYLATAGVGHLRATIMPLASVWFWTTIYFALFMSRDAMAALRGGSLSTQDRGFQVISSTLAVAVAWFATAHVGTLALIPFYFSSGGVMLLVAWSWRRLAADSLVPIFACKGWGLVALGVIAAFEGNARHLVLLVQAFVMLVSARQSRVPGLRSAAGVAGVVALSFYVGAQRASSAPFGGGDSLAEIAFLTGAIAFVGALRRWLSFGRLATSIGATVVGLVAAGTVAHWSLQGWTPAAYVAIGVLLFTSAGVLRAFLPAGIAAGVLLVAAHVEMAGWSSHGTYSLATLWWNELILLLAAVTAGWGVERIPDDSLRQPLRWTTAAFAVATLALVFFKGFTAGPAFAAGVALGVMLIGIAPRLASWPFAALSSPPGLLAGLIYMDKNHGSADPWLWVVAVLAWTQPTWLVLSPARMASIPPRGWRAATPVVQTLLATAFTLLAITENLHGPARLIGVTVAAVAALGLAWRPGLRPALEASWVFWLAAFFFVASSGRLEFAWFAVIVCWGAALALAHVPGLRPAASAAAAWRARAEEVQTWLAAGLSVKLAMNYQGSARMAAMSVAVGFAFAAWRWGWLAGARSAAIVIALVTWIVALATVPTPLVQGAGAGLIAVEAVAILLALLPLRMDRGLAPAARDQLRWAMAAMALGLAFFALLVQHTEVAPFATVGCGLAAVAMFLTGLFARSRPHRLCGLAGLALCVPRVFMVDLHSTLHRIAAFVALGVVLLWVGFSYHRFRHLIVDEDKKL